jgi:hypothetical protein
MLILVEKEATGLVPPSISNPSQEAPALAKD